MIYVFHTLSIEAAIITKKPKNKPMKIKKQYSIDEQLAIAVDVEAAQKQVSASSIIQKAVSLYFGTNKKDLKKPA